jgi:hypothetical protein
MCRSLSNLEGIEVLHSIASQAEGEEDAKTQSNGRPNGGVVVDFVGG